MFEVEYLWNDKVKKDKVNADIIQYDCSSSRKPIGFAFSLALIQFFLFKTKKTAKL